MVTMTCLSPLFQIVHQLIEFHETLYGRYFTGSHSLAIYNFLLYNDKSTQVFTGRNDISSAQYRIFKPYSIGLHLADL
jgi:hypothetical protein